jgi:hypothetical protein
MDEITVGVFMVRQVGGLLLAFWPFTASAIVILALATYASRSISRASAVRCLRYSVLMLAIAFIILIIGAVEHQPNLINPRAGHLEPSWWSKKAIYGFLLVYVGVGIDFIVQAKGFRFLASVIILIFGMITFISAFISFMAVTGDWL